MEFLVDVRWMLTLLTIFTLCDRKVAGSAACDSVIIRNSTYYASGQRASPDFPLLQHHVYTCTFQFEGTTSGEYLELIFADFILDGQDTGACHGDMSLLYAVSIQENSLARPVYHCERPKRQIIPLTGGAVKVKLVSRLIHILQAFNLKYRFLSASEGNRLRRQTTHEVTGHNFDPRYIFQGSIKDEIDQTSRERWVDNLQYIRAPQGHRVALNAAFMQDYRTTTFSIRDGATSYAEQMAQESSSMSSLGSVYMSSQEWIYIRWFGEASGGVALDIDFTFFKDAGSSGVCAGDYFKCTNNNCIPNKLLCNGVDNCYAGPTSNDEDPQGECKAIVSQVPLQFTIFPKKTTTRTDSTVTCRQELCRNGGSCINNVCVCQDGFTGTYCDLFDNTGGGPDYTDLQHTSIMIGAFVGAVCLLSICWLIAMARKRQTDTQPEGRLQRIVSVHSPEENGLRRQSTINVQSNVELPPNYSEACLYREGSIVNNKSPARGSISSNRRISADEPLSPPPSYEVVASEPDDDGGIVFRIPESVPEGDENDNDDVDSAQIPLDIISDQNNMLPDVVTSQEDATDNNPPMTRHDTPV